MAEPVKLRGFYDAPAIRTSIYDNVLRTAQNLEPMSNVRHTLRLDEVDYDDPGEYSLADEKKAILRGDTLSRRLKGTWSLVDNATGQTIDQKRTTVAHVPYLTGRGTIINNGVEYTIGSQLRLRPGIFARVKDSGELESHVNTLPGKGLPHRYFLDPESGVFHASIGQAKLPLTPILKAIGATDKQMRDAWGPEVFAANAMKNDVKALDKLFTKLGPKRSTITDQTERRQMAAQLFSAMELDPEVTTRTLGKPFKNLSPEAVLAATKKLLDISRGDAEADDRDHLAYQNIMGPEDLFAERLAKDAGGLRRKLLWKTSFKGNLKGLPAGTLTPQLKAVLISSGLGQALEETNPLDVLDQLTRITRLGEGGLTDKDAIPMESRTVQPSYLNFIDPTKTPESTSAGVDNRVAYDVKKGSDNRLYAPFRDVKTGKVRYMSPQDVAESTIVFPGELSNGEKSVAAMVGGKLRYVPRAQADLEPLSMEHSFSPLSNLVRMKSGAKGQRVSMGARFFAQALPLVNPETPLVQALMPDGDKSFEEHYGQYAGAVRAKQPGIVTDVNPNGISVKHRDGTTETYETYDKFPFNRKTYSENTAIVRPGDRVGSGQLLAKSNYTDDAGNLALGLNARTAYVSFRGLNHEDATVVSKSFANRASSAHMYQHELEYDDGTRRGKKPFIGIFPSKFDKKILDTLDDDGVVKPGTTVNYGEPLIVSAQQKQRGHHQLHRAHEAGFADKSVLWENSTPGIVTDIEKTNKGVTVAVKSIVPLQVGDKLSSSWGGKGIVSEIFDDDEMPHSPDGKPYEVLMNPVGTIARTNPANMIEAALGKVAAKTGKPYKIPDFDKRDYTQFALDELRRNGLTDIEDIVDPDTGRKIPGVFTGVSFLTKLHHTAEGKVQGRGIGGYTAEGTPARGSEGGAKRLGMLENNALLSHGAIENIRDAHLSRGQKNENFWLTFMQGHKPPPPRVPFIYEKFVNSLKASGINPVRTGSRLNIFALTDKDVNQLAGDRNITNAETVDWRGGLKEIKGGLFSPELTGGHTGNKWAALRLTEPMLSPVMEDPARRLLGLTEKRLRNVIAGREMIGEYTGPEGIQKALSEINIPKGIAQARADIASGRKTRRDDAVKKLGYLTAAQKFNIQPKDWVLSRVPVIPPAFRPVSIMHTGGQLVSDANFMYKELFDANDVLKSLKGKTSDIGDERLAVYDAFKGVTGLADPITPKNKTRRVKGFLDQLIGSSPKHSVMQSKLLGSTVDLVGRAVIAPNPDLDMDQIGIPENSAWEVYRPFIVRRLVRRGMPAIQAMRAAKDKTDIAKEMLLQEIKERPVLVNRAPTLHKFGLMAAWPVLVKGNVMQVPPLVLVGYNADFDGDTMSFHAMTSDEARTEAIEKMLPSRNLFSSRSMGVHMQPRHEHLAGLYVASNRVNTRNKARVFDTIQQAIAAYRRGDFGLDQQVEIGR